MNYDETRNIGRVLKKKKGFDYLRQFDFCYNLFI